MQFLINDCLNNNTALLESVISRLSLNHLNFIVFFSLLDVLNISLCVNSLPGLTGFYEHKTSINNEGETGFNCNACEVGNS